MIGLLQPFLEKLQCTLDPTVQHLREPAFHCSSDLPCSFGMKGLLKPFHCHWCKASGGSGGVLLLQQLGMCVPFTSWLSAFSWKQLAGCTATQPLTLTPRRVHLLYDPLSSYFPGSIIPHASPGPTGLNIDEGNQPTAIVSQQAGSWREHPRTPGEFSRSKSWMLGTGVQNGAAKMAELLEQSLGKATKQITTESKADL